MKASYKRLFLWSSLGSIAVGAAVTLARRHRRVAGPPLACRKIPRVCDGIHLWTERFEVDEGGRRCFARDRYYLQPTHFKVWSVLDLSFQGAPGRSDSEGAAIYHVAHLRLLEKGDENEAQEEAHLLDRFYGIITVIDAAGRSCGTNSIARGGTIAIRKCYVGGTCNGVESGEIHHSLGRILNYRIEIAPVEIPPRDTSQGTTAPFASRAK
ncbi:MAG: hypothetical protein LAP85_05545 [Acidobacteriia bacterium]|nr:hypothetical protein [Terriglobia bacterium]